MKLSFTHCLCDEKNTLHTKFGSELEFQSRGMLIGTRLHMNISTIFKKGQESINIRVSKRPLCADFNVLWHLLPEKNIKSVLTNPFNDHVLKSIQHLQ